MGNKVPTRQEAMDLLHKYNETDSPAKTRLCRRRGHALYRRKRGQDEEKWGVIGLIHDLDYEKYPAEHCSKTRVLLQEHGWPRNTFAPAVSHRLRHLLRCGAQQPTWRRLLYTIDDADRAGGNNGF